MKEYNPNDVGIPNGNYFTMPFTPEDSKIVLLSVPWDVTTSYNSGTSKGPDSIIEASSHLDFYDFDNPEGWKSGIGTIPVDYSILAANRKFREEAEKVIIHLESGGSVEENYAHKKLLKINEACERVNDYVYAETLKWIKEGKIVGIVGGEHSVPFGAVKAAAESEEGIGVLQIDAHADLRDAYEGFKYSHASAMFNILKHIKGVDSLVQVGIRDVCQDEIDIINNDCRIRCFSDHELYSNRFFGMTWDDQCKAIVDKLPAKVYISFDIDGLNPENCIATGTPVPGGISYNEAVYLLAKVAKSGRKIVGFDLCEVAPEASGEWNANVGARVLYKLCNLALLANQDK